MAASVDHYNIAATNGGCGFFQILGCNHAPLALGNRYHDTRAKIAGQRIVLQRLAVFGHVNFNIHMRGAVHDALPRLQQVSIFGVEFQCASRQVDT